MLTTIIFDGKKALQLKFKETNRSIILMLKNILLLVCEKLRAATSGREREPFNKKKKKKEERRKKNV